MPEDNKTSRPTIFDELKQEFREVGEEFFVKLPKEFREEFGGLFDELISVFKPRKWSGKVDTALEKIGKTDLAEMSDEDLINFLRETLKESGLPPDVRVRVYYTVKKDGEVQILVPYGDENSSIGDLLAAIGEKMPASNPAVDLMKKIRYGIRKVIPVPDRTRRQMLGLVYDRYSQRSELAKELKRERTGYLDIPFWRLFTDLVLSISAKAYEQTDDEELKDQLLKEMKKLRGISTVELAALEALKKDKVEDAIIEGADEPVSKILKKLKEEDEELVN